MVFITIMSFTLLSCYNVKLKEGYGEHLNFESACMTTEAVKALSTDSLHRSFQVVPPTMAM